ncbi:carboxypeptidase regulatory-like domain-containing protein [Pontibacter sp. HSC-14F20]|uniref:carboxypeptidase regulatory-like domain-containing protein n=1 Tax=Pontibacter sp. HSC-14F20 TaxID=2864136 RepID=UPI00210384EE|nr:carboxypeptidase regulatory-like domain-containing protein [Pontibacter sp. HSC-14F20]
MNRNFYIVTLVLIFCSCINSFGQNKTISGRIVDEHMNPLADAVIQTLDSVFTARADKDGNYVLTVPNKTKRIKAWAVGMETEVFKLSNNCKFNLILLDDIIAEFETVEEHQERYKKRKRELPRLYKEAIN